MPRINRTQKYAALWLYSQDWDVAKISNELELTDTQVKRILKETRDENKIKTASSVVSKNVNSKNLMITDSQSGKNKVSIMTKAASEINDENSKIYKNSKQSPNKNIYRPLG